MYFTNLSLVNTLSNMKTGVVMLALVSLDSSNFLTRNTTLQSLLSDLRALLKHSTLILHNFALDKQCFIVSIVKS